MYKVILETLNALVRRCYPYHTIQMFCVDVRGYHWASVVGEYYLYLTG